MIRNEEIDIGFTPEMVEIAWSPSDLKPGLRSETEAMNIRTYVNRRSVFVGRRFAGIAHSAVVWILEPVRLGHALGVLARVPSLSSSLRGGVLRSSNGHPQHVYASSLRRYL